MKKSCITRPIAMVILFLIAACSPVADDQAGEHHHSLEIDSGLAVLLKPANREIVSTVPTITAQYGTQLFSVEVPGIIGYNSQNQTSIASRIGGRIERLLVKYNYQPVKKGELIMEIYSPDLAAAQRDLLLIAKGRNEERLLTSAKQRLLLLGMSSSQIERVLRTGEVNYRIPVYSNASGFILEKNLTSSQNDPMTLSESKPVLLREGQYVETGQPLFSIYRNGGLTAEFSVPPHLSHYVKKGTSVLIQLMDSEETFKAPIGLIEPILKGGEAFTRAKVYLHNAQVQPGQLVEAHVPVMIKDSWWLPKEAVWATGQESVVFRKEKNVFLPQTVKTGITINGNVQITEDISGWELASKAHYLVDSESFIRPQN